MCEAPSPLPELEQRPLEAGRPSRRGVIAGAGAAATALSVGALTPAAAGVDRGGRASRRPRRRTSVSLLGVAGGPLWYPGTAGISTAHGTRDSDVFDCGEGAWSQYRKVFNPSGATGQTLRDLRAIFFTHLHSDHLVDYNNLLMYGGQNGLNARANDPVHVYGPGRRGSLTPLSIDSEPPLYTPRDPMPGIEETTSRLFKAFAVDFNERMRDTALPDQRTRVLPHDIPLPDRVVERANVNPVPRMDPITIHEDERVRVTATLVDHRPTFPSFAYRVDTDDGAVVISGDTAPTGNLVRLAKEADILVHEAFDPDDLLAYYPDPSTPEAQAVLHHITQAHTTIDQVGKVAARAGVGTLVLNHLNPASSKSRALRATRRHFSGRTVYGEDLLTVNV